MPGSPQTAKVTAQGLTFGSALIEGLGVGLYAPSGIVEGVSFGH